LPELERLRGPASELSGQRVPEGRLSMDGTFPPGLELELVARGGTPLALRLVDAGGGTLIAQVRHTGDALEVQDTVAPFSLAAGEMLRLRLFLDQSLLEVFAGDGRLVVTRILERTAPELRVELLAAADAQVERLSVWPLSLA
jgi:hypothetical protein